MSTLTDRLRGVIGPRKGPPEGGPYEDSEGPPKGGPYDDPEGPPKGGPHDGDEDVRGGRLQAAQDAAEVLGGEWRESGAHRFLVVDRRYLPGHRHGRMSIADYLPPADGVWATLPLLTNVGRDVPGTRDSTRALFLDLETTGLAGGAGTYAFLVGCAWFDAGVLRVRQFFLADYSAERAMLDALHDVIDPSCVIVTYNGKSFDVPLIDTRFQLHRLETPFSGLEHVDMLHPARRLWRQDEAEPPGAPSGCRLSALESSICGHEREGDVPGFQIPSRYFHYVRTGDSRPLEAVLEHNRLDLISLALVTAHAARLLEEGPAAARTCREALGLGRLYERAGRVGDAKACFARAAGRVRGSDSSAAEVSARADALRAYAVLCRRERSHDEAAGAWRDLLGLTRCPPHIARQATEALAVHHEHRLRDPRAARSFAMRSLEFEASQSQAEAARHRLARLDRKLSQPTNALLF